MATINTNSSTTEHRYYDIKINPSFYGVYVSIYASNGIKRELIYYDCVKEGEKYKMPNNSDYETTTKPIPNPSTQVNGVVERLELECRCIEQTITVLEEKLYCVLLPEEVQVQKDKSLLSSNNSPVYVPFVKVLEEIKYDFSCQQIRLQSIVERLEMYKMREKD